MPAEHMIEAAKLASPLDGTDIRRFLDDADQCLVSSRICADCAQLTFGEVEASLARMNALGEGDECFGELAALLRGLLEEVVGEPQRCLASDAG